LVKEGMGIRSISRHLHISATTVLSKIVQIARSIKPPPISMYKSYEVDELCTYYKRKTSLLWVAYAIRRDTGTVTCFTIGSRTSHTLRTITDTLILSNATTVYTDKLQLYRQLLPATMHCNKQHCTNNIERKNLSLRTHLKRLSRRTICYTKSKLLLESCLRLYFWG
jgi:IS1 family transposase